MPSTKFTRLPLLGLTSLCLLLFLTGCASTGRTQVLLPPDDLLQDCVADAVEPRTNLDLLRLIQSQRAALAGCNADKAALRAWGQS